MILETNQTNLNSLSNSNNSIEKYLNLYHEKCYSCNKRFNKNDLLKKKVHITSCDHFFHKNCLKEYFTERPKDWNHCEFCKHEIDFFKEHKQIKEIFKKNKAHIFNTLDPVNLFKLKRPREGDNEVTEPSQKKQKLGNQLDIPKLPIEIWEKIWFDQLNFETSKDLCLSLKKIIRIRTVSKGWSQILTIDYISKVLKIQLVNSNINIQNMFNPLKENSLMIACDNKEIELVKILLKGSNDIKNLLKQTDSDGNTAFHISAKRNDSVTLALLLEAAQSLNLEIESLQDNDEHTFIDYLFRFSVGHSEACLKLIIENNNNNLDFIGKLFYKAVSERDGEIIIWLCDNYLINHPNKFKVFIICMSNPYNQGSAFSIAARNHHLAQKLINCLGEEYAWKMLSRQEFNNRGELTMTPLHEAISAGVLPSVQVIIEAAGPRALELLEQIVNKKKEEYDDS